MDADTEAKRKRVNCIEAIPPTAYSKPLSMARLFLRPIREIFRPQLSDKLELIAELHQAEGTHLPEGHLVRQKRTGVYFMYRGGGLLINMPQDAVIANLRESGLLQDESPALRVKRELAELVRSWRRKARINTREAGERLGLSARTIEGIEQQRGFSHPNLLVLAMLQAAKGVASR